MGKADKLWQHVRQSVFLDQETYLMCVMCHCEGAAEARSALSDRSAVIFDSLSSCSGSAFLFGRNPCQIFHPTKAGADLITLYAGVRAAQGKCFFYFQTSSTLFNIFTASFRFFLCEKLLITFFLMN